MSKPVRGSLSLFYAYVIDTFCFNLAQFVDSVVYVRLLLFPPRKRYGPRGIEQYLTMLDCDGAVIATLGEQFGGLHSHYSHEIALEFATQGAVTQEF